MAEDAVRDVVRKGGAMGASEQLLRRVVNMMCACVNTLTLSSSFWFTSDEGVDEEATSEVLSVAVFALWMPLEFPRGILKHNKKAWH